MNAHLLFHPLVEHWVYRDAYDVLTITAWRPMRTIYVFIVEDFG